MHLDCLIQWGPEWLMNSALPAGFADINKAIQSSTEALEQSTSSNYKPAEKPSKRFYVIHCKVHISKW